MLGSLQGILHENALKYGFELKKTGLKNQVRELLEHLAATGPKPALLIDEYDKPMLDQIDPALADENRQVLKDFYDRSTGNEVLQSPPLLTRLIPVPVKNPHLFAIQFTH